MRGFGNSFKHQPWRSLLQAASLTMIGVLLLEFGLSVMERYRTPGLYPALTFLFQPPIDLFIGLGFAIVVGISAVWILERCDRPCITTGSLWGLVLCLLVLLVLKQMIGSDSLISLNEPQVVALIVGVFFQGRSYWRGFRHW